MCWLLAGVSRGSPEGWRCRGSPRTEGCVRGGVRVTAGKQPSTVLGWRRPVPTPLAEQLLVLGSHTSVQAHCSQEMVCTGPMASLSPHPHLERPSWGEAGTGHTCGQAAGQHLQGCQVLGSLGAEALHNATALHAIKKEEVVVRRVPLRQGLGRKTRGFSSDASKG